VLLGWPVYSQPSGMDGLSRLTPQVERRQITPENPTGERGKGAMAIPNPADPALAFSEAAKDLGQGWKVNPFVKVKAHTTHTVMDVDGPGTIRHILMITGSSWKRRGRDGVLRFYWDGEATPSVEVPMTDFFAIGHDEFAQRAELLLADAVPQARAHHVHERLRAGPEPAHLPD
jgi:hypothetical protein